MLVAAVLALQGLAFFVYRHAEAERGREPEPWFPHERVPRQPAPDVTLVRPDGSTRRLAELRGKAVLLHFWASWCVPCREELPGLLRAGRAWAGEGGPEVVALSLDEEWTEGRRFFGEEDIPQEVYRDGGGSAAGAYEVSALPDTYLLAPDGTLRLRFGGARDWESRAAEEVLRTHLPQPFGP